jgi:hypothetical protein
MAYIYTHLRRHSRRIVWNTVQPFSGLTALHNTLMARTHGRNNWKIRRFARKYSNNIAYAAMWEEAQPTFGNIARLFDR